MKTEFGRKFHKMIDELSPEELRALAVKCGVSEDAFETTPTVDEPVPPVKSVSEALRELATWLDAEAEEWDHEGYGDVIEDYAGRAGKVETLATRCEGMYSADEVRNALYRMKAQDHAGGVWFDLDPWDIDAFMVFLGGTKPKGMVSLEAVEEAVLATLKECPLFWDYADTGLGVLSDSLHGLITESVKDRLKGGS